MKSILFNAEMTRAILDGRKSQTRRLTYHQDVAGMEIVSKSKNAKYAGKYQIGEVLWVREPAKIDMCFTEEMHFHYLADNTTSKLGIPKRFIKDGFVVDWMSHCNGIPNGCINEMARIFLKITDVRVERLLAISRGDIKNEGCPADIIDGKELPNNTPTKWFISVWNKTAQKGYKWEDNPCAFVYEFKRVNKDGSDYE